VVHVFAQAPVPGGATERALIRLKKKRIEVLFTLPDFEPSVVEAMASAQDRAIGAVVGEAVLSRVRASKRRAERSLRRLGIKLRASTVRMKAGEALEPVGKEKGK
jgi:hypothetical protein